MTVETRENRSLGELFAELSAEVSTLIRKEVELARHEMTRSMTRIGRAAGLVAAGGLIAYAGLIVVLVGVAALLATLGLPDWVALLLVGAIVIAVGGFLVMRYLQELRQASVVPERTVETIQDNVRWAKEQTR
ncbi:MAG: phage holin family protein [Chloroflexota bacterium]|nr:phage holin family protein [Chloroflexota bacterium]